MRQIGDVIKLCKQMTISLQITLYLGQSLYCPSVFTLFPTNQRAEEFCRILLSALLPEIWKPAAECLNIVISNIDLKRVKILLQMPKLYSNLLFAYGNTLITIWRLAMLGRHTGSLRSWAYTSKKIVVLVYGTKSDFEIEKIDTLTAWI